MHDLIIGSKLGFDFCSIHDSSAHGGQSRVPPIDEVVLLHFVSFIHADGCIYELDGRKPFPINHGPCSAHSLLQDAVNVIKAQYIDPGLASNPDIRYSIIALAPTLGGAL